MIVRLFILCMSFARVVRLFGVWGFVKKVFVDLYGLIFGRTVNCLMMGLDNAGKTTFAHLLGDGNFGRRPLETTIATLTFRFHDVPMVIAEYFPLANVVLFVVDASDRHRFREAKDRLDALLQESSLPQHVPIAILGNKLDVDNAAGEVELRCALGLAQTTGKVRHVCCLLFKFIQFLDRTRMNSSITTSITVVRLNCS
jgi:GTP-binding protein SAR1